MAENTTISQFGKGIALNCGFDLGAQTLLDSRALVKDMEELEAMPQIRRANGLAVWVQDERRLMVWDEPNNRWVDVTASVDTSAVEKSLADLAERVSGNTERLETHTTEITEIRKTIEELNPECRFDDTADHETKTAHGGLPAGTNIRGWKLAEILDWVLFPVVEPTVKSCVFTDADGTTLPAKTYKLGKLTETHKIAHELQLNDLKAHSDCLSPQIKVEYDAFAPIHTTLRGTFNTYSYEGYFVGGSAPGAIPLETLDISDGIASWSKSIAETLIVEDEDFEQIVDNAIQYIKSVKMTMKWTFYDYNEKRTSKLFPALDKTYTASATLTFVKPIYVGVIGQNKTLSTDSDVAQYYNGTIENLDSGRAELIIADSVKTQKVNIPAFDNRQMCIVSPRKVTKILNPSSFDITQSFTLTTKNTGALADADTEAGIPAGYADTDLYVYTSDLTSQAADYPLTITFE